MLRRGGRWGWGKGRLRRRFRDGVMGGGELYVGLVDKFYCALFIYGVESVVMLTGSSEITYSII